MGLVRDFPHQPVLCIMEKDLKNIFRISERNMDFPICIQEASIHIKTLEKHWGYWCRYIYINRYMDAPKPVYQNLYDLVKEKGLFCTDDKCGLLFPEGRVR